MRRFSIIIIGLILPFSGFGQNVNLPKNVEVFKPERISKSVFTEEHANSLNTSSNWGQNNRSSDPWVVYSDRANNITYSQPDEKSQVYSTLYFNEPLRIAKIKSGFALVYSEPESSERKGKISTNALSRGWVPMSKLLLWDRCPTNNRMIIRKAMFCVNLDEKIKTGDKIGHRYFNPENLNESDEIHMNFQYYFIIKTEGDMLLLSTQSKLDGISSNVLYGWVHRNSIIPWDQRTCLEPTWEEKDVRYFASTNNKVPIISKDGQLKTEISFKIKPNVGNDPDAYRMPGDVLRYPILEGSDDAKWHLSTFSRPGGGSINLDDSEARINAKKREAIKQLQQVNIAIVIDGTKSMNAYYDPVKSAIRQVTSYFAEAQNVTVKVGAVIYRDYVDGNEAVAEVFPMTNPLNPKLNDWLSEGGRFGIRSSDQDNTLSEALFMGINRAIDAFRFDPKHSNFMFIIGDCGNDENDMQISRDDLVRKISNSNINLVGFQVRNHMDSPSYASFNAQIQYLMRKSVEQRKKAIGVNSPIQITRKADGIEYTPEDGGETYFFATHKYVKEGSNMDSYALFSQMTSAFDYVKHSVQDMLDIIVRSEEYYRPENSTTISEIPRAILEDRLGKELTELFTQKNTTLSFRGFAPKKDPNGREYFKPVVFISQEEFSRLLQRLQPLYDASVKGSNDRTPFINAAKALVQSLIPGVGDQEMMNMDMKTILVMLSGIDLSVENSQGSLFTKYMLSDVASTAAVNAATYREILNEFKVKYQGLRNIQQRPYRFVRSINGANYYWIPVEKMP